MYGMESLDSFRARTGGFVFNSLPLSGGLETGEGLAAKVGADGKMRPFMGNTVVFPLQEEAKQALRQIQERLYGTCAPVLAERLEVSSFHITLHDLMNGAPSRELEERMADVKGPALACVRRIAEKGEVVRLRSTALFNMVNTSMVLGFEPEDEESCGRLMGWYEMFQEVLRLGYPLTPHVTVAYFRPGRIPEEQAGLLREAVEEAGRGERISVRLCSDGLEYQVFEDMNRYWRET